MAIDARLRQRRVAVLRAAGRRRLRLLATALGLVLVIVGVWGLTRTALLDLDHVNVDGVEGTEVAVVESLANLERGTAMFDLDLGAARAAVAELPWIKSVAVERSWPGSVDITVARRAPVAVLAGDGGAFLVDEEGVVIAELSGDSTLPVVEWTVTAMPGEAEREALPAIAVARSIPDDLAPWVESVTMTSGTAGSPVDLGLDLTGSASADLGNADLIEDKLAAVRAVLQRTDLACLDVIDVTVADLATITRDEVCDAATGGGEVNDG